MSKPGQRTTAQDMIGAVALVTGSAVFIEAEKREAGNGDDKDKDKKLPSFEMTAYTGGKMDVAGWWLPLVIKLSGINFGKKSRPILLNHDHDKIVGHTSEMGVTDGQVSVKGLISGTGEAAREVLGSGANGFPWQASVGVQAKEVVRVEAGSTAKVNGMEFEGPLFVIQKSAMREVSFVPLGADDDTEATVAAGAPRESADEQEDLNMATVPEVVATAASAEALNSGINAVEAIRSEHARIAAINAACVTAPEIATQAIKEGWTSEKAELHALKARTVRKDQDTGVGNPATAEVRGAELGAMKASVLTGHVAENVLLASFGEEAMEAARRFRRMGLRELAAVCCGIDGISVARPGCSEAEWARAAFSSTSFTDLLNDSANKTLLAAYNAVPSVARLVAKALSASDFKVHKGLRLTGDLLMKKVENGGEIQHGTLGEGSYSYSLDTYGRMIGLTRQDLINDDLGAFTQLPQMFGRGAALAVEQAFWTLALANTGTFFGSGNANYISGATTALSIDGLSEAVQALEEQVDADGNPVAVMGKYLVVPPALKATAQQLYVSANIIAGTATAKQGAVNVHAGLYEPLSTPYLKSKAKEWYVLGDPADVACFGIAWLNGVQEPVVEEVAVSGEYLGRCWRGYIDFGVCQVDHRGGVKSKGEA